MTIKIALAAAALAAAALGSTTAGAQPGWGPGWTEYREHRAWGPGAPVFWDRPGRYRGWYRYNNRYYQHCGWRDGRHGRRFWRCF